MLIPSENWRAVASAPSLSRRVNANSQLYHIVSCDANKLIKKGEC